MLDLAGGPWDNAQRPGGVRVSIEVKFRHSRELTLQSKSSRPAVFSPQLARPHAWGPDLSGASREILKSQRFSPSTETPAARHS